MEGVTIYFNGSWYYFESAEDFEELLSRNCNDAGYESMKECIIEYGN